MIPSQRRTPGVFVRILVYLVAIPLAFLALVPNSFELLHLVANGEISGAEFFTPFLPDKAPAKGLQPDPPADILTGVDVRIASAGVYTISIQTRSGNPADVVERLIVQANAYCQRKLAGDKAHVRQKSHGHHPLTQTVDADIEFDCVGHAPPRQDLTFTAAEQEEWERLGAAIAEAQTRIDALLPTLDPATRGQAGALLRDVRGAEREPEAVTDEPQFRLHRRSTALQRYRDWLARFSPAPSLPAKPATVKEPPFVPEQLLGRWNIVRTNSTGPIVVYSRKPQGPSRFPYFLQFEADGVLVTLKLMPNDGHMEVTTRYALDGRILRTGDALQSAYELLEINERELHLRPLPVPPPGG